ncbi:MAG: hypothetical protein K2W95_29925 [Candidatus Obscuribacterales bacterium]|nr:hypothetical protein [Candidatus Obscuribacterales bacterium]
MLIIVTALAGIGAWCAGAKLMHWYTRRPENIAAEVAVAFAIFSNLLLLDVAHTSLIREFLLASILTGVWACLNGALFGALAPDVNTDRTKSKAIKVAILAWTANLALMVLTLLCLPIKFSDLSVSQDFWGGFGVCTAGTLVHAILLGALIDWKMRTEGKANHRG